MEKFIIDELIKAQYFTVGYILGLGDRHVQNILIDTNTAELVHIDLGRSNEIEKISASTSIHIFA